MTLHIPDELQPFKKTLNNLPVEYYEAIFRKYAELAAVKKEEFHTTLREVEEYLSTTPDTLERQVSELIRRTNEVFDRS